MAPFRPSGRSNRSGRSQIDHDVFEGLPIRQWRQADTVVGPAVGQTQEPLPKDAWPEPPMPRDSNLLPEHSQQLLRAARSGRLYKLPTPPEDEEKEKVEEDEEAKEVQTGFVAKKWSQVPRNLEEPEQEYLAKRRKGLPSAYSGYVGINGPLITNAPMRETKVKKTEVDGTIHIYKVLVPEGQTVEGEVVEEDIEMKEAAPVEAMPGTVVEGVGVVNAEGVVVANDLLQPTPPRRRPPPPRRKPKKGPGRGRKKVMFTPGESDNAAIGGQVDGAQAGDANAKRTEGTPATGEDTPMADAQEGEEDDEGEEGSGSGSDDEDREDGELSPTPAGATPLPKTEQPAPTSAPPAGASAIPAPTTSTESAPAATDADPTPAPPPAPAAEGAPAPVIPQKRPVSEERDPSSSPELPLASAVGHGSQNSANQPASPQQADEPEEAQQHVSETEIDLFGSLEAQLEKESEG